VNNTPAQHPFIDNAPCARCGEQVPADERIWLFTFWNDAEDEDRYVLHAACLEKLLVPDEDDEP
jgi:hypothetical protein